MFHSWSAVIYTLIVGSLSYLANIVLIRISGKRTLSKWNAFDFVVTIALGSMLATLFLSRSTSLMQGVVGFGALIAWQYVVTWLSCRFRGVENLVKTQPTLLAYRGRLRWEALKQERVTEEEIKMALRTRGIADIEDVDAVVLEPNGSFSVIEKIDKTPAWALVRVKGYDYQ